MPSTRIPKFPTNAQTGSSAATNSAARKSPAKSPRRARKTGSTLNGKTKGKSTSSKSESRDKSHASKKQTVKPALHRQNSLWYQTMMNQRFRQFVRLKHTKSSLLKTVESPTSGKDNGKGFNEEQKYVVFSEACAWKMISWVSRARASLKLKRFRFIQEQLRKDLDEHLLVDHKEGFTFDPQSDFVMMSGRKTSPPKREPYVVARLGKEMLNEVNPKLYTVENLYNRERLASNHQIIFHIVNWWLQMRKIPGSLKNNCFGEVSEEHYKQMLTCIYRILVPDGDDEHMAEIVEKDWIEDSNGRASVDIENFVRSIFALTDIWTNSCEGEEYIEFIMCLHSLVARECDLLNWNFISSFESHVFDEEDDDLQAYLELLRQRSEQATQAKKEEEQSTIKKKKIRSYKSISLKQVETQLLNLPSLREYFHLMLKVKKNTLRHEKDEMKRLTSIFRSFDPNGDGSISAKEMQSAIRLVRGHHLHIKVVKRLIEEGDANSDGQISFDEFLKLMLPGDVEGQGEPENQQQEILQEEILSSNALKVYPMGEKRALKGTKFRMDFGE